MLRERLLAHSGPVAMPHLRPAIYAGVAAAVAASIAAFTREPFVFPSLGATAYLCATAPKSPGAQPRSVLLSHLVAAIVGFVLLKVLGLDSHPAAAVEGMTTLRIVAVTLSLAGTVAITSLIATLHPPAGATTLIVTLGILSSAHQVTILMLSICAFAGSIWVFKRLQAVPKPRSRRVPVVEAQAD